MAISRTFGNRGAAVPATAGLDLPPATVPEPEKIIEVNLVDAKEDLPAEGVVTPEPNTKVAASTMQEKGLAPIVKGQDTPQALKSFIGGGALAFFDFAADPFALFDFNGADNNLGQTLPLRRIEYCASKGTEALKKGLITDMATMEQKPSVRAVLVAMKFSRVWMPDYDPTSEANEPLCVSLDGSRRTKGSNTRIPEEQLCAECLYMKWQPGQKRPDCSEVYTLLMLDVDDCDTPFLFSLRRTGIKPLRMFRNALKVMALRVWTQESGVPANLCAEFLLGSMPEKNFYLPTFTELKAVSLQRATELARRLAPIIQTFNKQDTTDAIMVDDAGEAGDV